MTLPLVLWCFIEGSVGVARVVVTLLVVALLFGVIAAVSLAFSALFARTTTSAVLSYLTVFALAIGTLVVFSLALAATTTRETSTDRLPGQAPVTYTQAEAHPERVWWILAPNPFVILADAAPRVSPQRDPETGLVETNPADPLGGLSEAVRSTRRDETFSSGFGEAGPEPGPVWPYGVGFHIALGLGAVAVTARRLRTPYRSLPRSVRVA